MPAVLRRVTSARIEHHVDALPPGARLGEFEVVSLLGVGGFGLVYQAFDHTLRRCVAIKEYMPAALAGRADGHSLWVRSSSDEQSFQAGLASFVDEARLLARFDHPSLVKVYRFWEANQTAYMVMPLYRGMTLKQARAHMRTPPPEAWLRQLLWSVTSALRVLHDGHTLHRDISPDNIFLQDRGPPVLLDLGAARHAIGGSRQKHAAVLKVNYAPLEQYGDAAGHLRQGPWSDLYALGAMVHGCLCNDTPLPATQRAVRDRMAPLQRVARTVRRQFGVEYSRPFVEAIAQCLALQPRERPQSVAALLQTMDMEDAPAGLEAFDFRAGLGDIWVEPQARDAQGVAVPMMAALTLSQPQSAPQAPAAAAPAFPAAAMDGGDAPAGGQARMMWAMAGSAAAMVLAGGLWWGQRAHPPRHTPESEIITELAEPAPPPGLMRATHEAGAARRPVAEADRPTPYLHAGALPAAPPVPAPRTALPAHAPGPDEACASVGFFARSMCVHRECQKAGMARYPVCVESRLRQEALELRQLYAQ
ncbi:serine/threonine protein kinase [Alicycliphilus denitrificans]|uniref:serine/threonine protein kinase n=1 Tax=Alicycliphilus denitrificans TaxID=179636 RepID=UPI00384D6FFE